MNVLSRERDICACTERILDYNLEETLKVPESEQSDKCRELTQASDWDFTIIALQYGVSYRHVLSAYIWTATKKLCRHTIRRIIKV